MNPQSISCFVFSLLAVCTALAQDGQGWKHAPLGAPIDEPSTSTQAGATRTATSGTALMSASLTVGANCPVNVTPQPGQLVISEEVTPEITALANNLENDPKRIYDYVHNYIKYVHYFGSKKGAFLTLMEGSGNDFDQCALLVALLRAAAQNLGTPNAYSVKYHFGVMKMPYQTPDNVDLKHWLGLTLDEASDQSNYSDYVNLLNQLNRVRGTPEYNVNSFTPKYYLMKPQTGPMTIDRTAFIFHRVWVKLAYPDGTAYCLDPAFKISTFIPGIDVAAAMQFNLSDLLTQISSGANVDANSAQNLSWINLNGKLTTYTANLISDLKNTHPNLSVDQVISGYAIQESETQTFPGLPFAPLDSPFTVYDTSVNGATVTIPVLEWDNIPPGYLSTMRLQIAGDTVDVTYNFPALKGRKLSLTFVNSQVKIALDDDQEVRLGATGITTPAVMTTTISHPFGSWNFSANAVSPLDPTRGNDNDHGRAYQRTAAGYAVTYGFDDPDQLLTRRQQKLDSYIRQGFASSSPEVVTETLNVMGLYWIQQTYLAAKIIGSQKDILVGCHHRVGRVAQETGTQLGYYVDLPLNYDTSVWRAGNPFTAPGGDPALKFFKVEFILWSAMEHGVIEQLQTTSAGAPVTASSTVKTLYLANANHQKLILGTPANYSAVQQLLANEPSATRFCSADQNTLLTAVNQAGATVLLPSGFVTVNSWNGYGYAPLVQNGSLFSFGMLIQGNYRNALNWCSFSGGFSGSMDSVNSTYQNNLSYINSPQIFNTAPPTATVIPGADPVNMLDGSFTLNSVDLSVGQTEPRGFSFARHYDSNRRYYNQANLANGWTHNYIINAAERNDPAAALGKNTAQEAAAFIVASRAAYELLNTTDANYASLHWAATALVAEWGVDQLKNNAVNFTMGSQTVQFVKQPDGTYTPPAGVTLTLTKPNGYQLQQRHGNTFNFYSPTTALISNKVSTIVDQYGKTMTFNYTSTNLTSVVDSWGAPARTLTFTYNTAIPKQLTSITAHTGADVGDRTVTFTYGTTYSSQGDLLSVIDPETKTWTYEYDGEHKITKTKDPTAPTPRVITQNAYDSDGKVTQQLSQGDSTKPWNIYAAGGRVSVQKDPQGGRTIYYYDQKHRLTATKDPNGNKSSSVYDGQDHVAQSITPLGELTQFNFDGSQNILMVTDPMSKYATFLYNSDNTLHSKTDFRGKTTSYTYNTKFQVLTITAPNVNNDPAMPNVVTLAYNNTDVVNGPAGTLASQTDQDNKTTSFQYDSWGQLTKATYPNTDFETSVNSSRGDVTSHTDAKGVVSNFTYNKRRQLTQSTVDPTGLNLITQLIYDDVGNLWKTIDPRNNTTINTYSATQKLLTKTLPTLASGTPVIVNTYDKRDWLQSVANPLTQAITYGYDAGGRLTTVTDPLLHATTYGYDSDSHKTSIRSALLAQNQTTTYGYNARGEQTSLTDPATFAIGYTYDDNGNPLSIVNRNNGTFGSTYYGDNRLWTSQTPSGKTTTRTYIKRGLLASLTEPSSQQTTFAYDDRGRLQTKTDPVGTSNYTYDKNNNKLAHTENGKTITRVYDNNNRLTSYTDENNNVIGYQYDNNGNLTKLTYPGGIKYVNYAYDSNSRLITVTDWANRVTGFTYDLAGRVTSITRPNGTVRTIAYDAAGQTTKITEANSAGLAIAYFKLGYDEAGRINNEFIAPIPATFSESSETITHDADNRIATFNGQTVVHDLDGNMTSGPLNGSTPVTHTFDARNRLTAVAASGAAPALNYTYDSEGNRTGIVQAGQTTSFVINPAATLPQVLVRTKPDGTKTYYVYGLGLLYQVDDAGNTVTYHFDYRGSTVALTASSGQVTDRVEYNTYGLITVRTGNTDVPFLYNGRYGVMTDANGLYYMRARYYNPYIKRFINADPTGMAGGINWYAYADGNPTSLIDPFGLSPLEESESVWDQFKELLITGDTWWQAPLYTGESHPTADVLNAATAAAGDYVHDYGAVRGFFAGAGSAGKLGSGTYMPGYAVSGEVNWTIEGGSGGKIEVGGGLQMRGSTTLLGMGTKPYVSEQIGVLGSYEWNEASGGFSSGQFSASLYGGQANKVGGYAFEGNFDSGTLSTFKLGITYGNIGGGIIVDPSRLVNLFRFDLPDAEENVRYPALPLPKGK